MGFDNILPMAAKNNARKILFMTWTRQEYVQELEVGGNVCQEEILVGMEVPGRHHVKNAQF